jgi:hypothetical protein
MAQITIPARDWRILPWQQVITVTSLAARELESKFYTNTQSVTSFPEGGDNLLINAEIFYV